MVQKSQTTTWNVLKLKVDYPYQLVFSSDFWSINSLSFVRNPNSKGLMRFHESQELGKQIGWDLPQGYASFISKPR